MNLESACLLAGGAAFSVISHTVRNVIGNKMTDFQVRYLEGSQKGRSASKKFSKCVKYLPINEEYIPIGIAALGLVAMFYGTITHNPDLVFATAVPALTHVIELARKQYIKNKYNL